jgi:hypothetical protein
MSSTIISCIQSLCRFSIEKLILMIVIFFFCISQVKAQSFQQQSRQIFGYNVILNGVIGGIGGVINKSKEEKILRTFGRNFLKGALGGVITYASKYNIYELRNPEKFWMAPINRAVYYLGNSFVYNASLNQGLFNTYRCQFYLFNFNVQFKDKFKISARLSVLSMASFGTFLILGDHLNLKNSLNYGVFYFDENKKYIYTRDGLGLNNAIEISAHPPDVDESFRYTVISHEMIHTYQFADYFSISNFTKQSFKGIKAKENYIKLSKYFYLDGPFFPILYVIYPKPYYDIFYEYEANHFSTREFVDRE